MSCSISISVSVKIAVAQHLLWIFTYSSFYSRQIVYAKAKPLLFKALEGRQLKLGDIHLHTLESWKNLIALYETWNKPEKAKKWRAKLEQIEDFGE
jgi:hypothetical protein